MQVKPGRIFLGRFAKNSDLLSSLTEFCREENIRLGSFHLIGSVLSVNVAYYNQVTHNYVENVRSEARLEIVSCTGNISVKDADPAVHAHIIFADDKGNCFGGHLMPGTRIFAAEYCIREWTDAELMRKHDPDTGLFLW